MAEMLERNIHFNTRVRAFKSRLFPRAFYEEFIDHRERGVPALTDALLESPYRTEMAEALTRHEGAEAVEEAVRRNLAATFAYLNHHADEPLRTLIRTFTTRWDLGAIKSLLRCRIQGIEAADALPYIKLGPGIPVALMMDLVRSSSLQDLVEKLAAWNPALCRSLRHALPEALSSGNVAILEEALDRAYFVARAAQLVTADDADSAKLRTYLQAEIDRINLRTIFQHFQSAGSNGTPVFLPRGGLREDLLERMAAAPSAPAAMELLEGTRYSRLVEELFQFMQTGRFSPIERYFERFLIRMLQQFARRDIFGIGVPMEYAWLKYNEVVNLRLVARGLSGNVPPGRVREELYCP